MSEQDNGNGVFTDEDFNQIVNNQDTGVDLNKDGKGGLLTAKMQQRQGVLVRLLRAHDNHDLRQDLKLANFKTSDEADEFVSAIDECLVLNMDPTPIIDQMYARSAGEKNDFVRLIIDGLTHTSHTTNTPRPFKDDQGNKNTRSF